MVSAGIRLKDPSIGLELGEAGCFIEFQVKPFSVSGKFDGVSVELSMPELKRFLHDLGERVPKDPPKERKEVPYKWRPKRKDASSNFRGVHKDGGKKKRNLEWKAQIRSRNVYLFKAFATELEAAAQYNEWVTRYSLPMPLNMIP